MVLAKLKKISKNKLGLQDENPDAQIMQPAIILLEDDVDQMNLLFAFIVEESDRIVDSGSVTEEQLNKLAGLKIIKVSNINSLKKAVSTHKNILLAILDCNTPDRKGDVANDQFVKTGHRITGQHRATDVVLASAPNAPITMMSSFNRFRTIVNKFYASNFDINIKFIKKENSLILKNNIAYHLREYLNMPNG